MATAWVGPQPLSHVIDRDAHRLDYSCENVYDPLLPIANSNDPYIYIDPWTSRIVKFDMHALLGMTVEWSDDEGGWNGRALTLLRSRMRPRRSRAPTCPPSCIPPPGCSASMGMPRTPCAPQVRTVGRRGGETSGAPIDCASGGLSAHLVGSVDGNFYRGISDAAVMVTRSSGPPTLG